MITDCQSFRPVTMSGNYFSSKRFTREWEQRPTEFEQVANIGAFINFVIVPRVWGMDGIGFKSGYHLKAINMKRLKILASDAHDEPILRHPVQQKYITNSKWSLLLMSFLFLI